MLSRCLEFMGGDEMYIVLFAILATLTLIWAKMWRDIAKADKDIERYFESLEGENNTLRNNVHGLKETLKHERKRFKTTVELMTRR